MSTPAARPSVDRAIIPAAGLGTRLRPLTNAIPKEMLPLGRKPVLEYVIEELRGAGVTQMLLVISPHKQMIRDYFGEGSRWGVRCEYVLQHEMNGLGDAILHGADWSAGETAVVAFGDCLVEARGERREARESLSPLARLVETHLTNSSTATVLTERIPREKSGKYGIIAPKQALCEEADEPFPCRDIVEKPKPEETPSTWAVAARWVLEPDIMERLRCAKPGPDGEVNLTDSVRAAVREGAALWAVPLTGRERRLDIGGWDSYLMASAEFAVQDEEFGEHVRHGLCGGKG